MSLASARLSFSPSTCRSRKRRRRGVIQRTRFWRAMKSCHHVAIGLRSARSNLSRKASPSGDSAASAPYWVKVVVPVLATGDSMLHRLARLRGCTSQPMRQPVIAQGLEKELITNTASSSSAICRKDGAWLLPS